MKKVKDMELEEVKGARQRLEEFTQESIINYQRAKRRVRELANVYCLD